MELQNIAGSQEVPRKKRTLQFVRDGQLGFPSVSESRGHENAYLGCTLPWAGCSIQFCECSKVRALGTGIGAVFLGMSKSFCQTGLCHRLNLLQRLWQKLEMDLHHCKETPTQHLERQRSLFTQRFADYFISFSACLCWTLDSAEIRMPAG